MWSSALQSLNSPGEKVFKPGTVCCHSDGKLANELLNHLKYYIICHTSHTITNNLLQAVLGVIVGALQLPVQLLHLRPRLDGGWQSLLDM